MFIYKKDTNNYVCEMGANLMYSYNDIFYYDRIVLEPSA
jgi:hypothetical protein